MNYSRFSPNRLFWQFADAIRPDSWKSKQAKRMYDAAIEAEAAGQDVASAVSGSVKIARRPNDGIMCPYGTDQDTAAKLVQDKIRQMRAEADRIEKVLASYGGAAFVVNPEAVQAPAHPFNAEDALMSVLRGNHDRIWIHGVEFVRDSSNAFVLA